MASFNSNKYRGKSFVAQPLGARGRGGKAARAAAAAAAEAEAEAEAARPVALSLHNVFAGLLVLACIGVVVRTVRRRRLAARRYATLAAAAAEDF